MKDYLLFAMQALKHVWWRGERRLGRVEHFVGILVGTQLALGGAALLIRLRLPDRLTAWVFGLGSAWFVFR